MNNTVPLPRWTFGSAALVLLLAGPVFGQPGNPALPCHGEAGFHVLDFWLGTWDVLAEGGKQGTNRIEKILDGCAIMEHWTDVIGGAGKSLFYYTPATDTWKQVWITQDTTRPGGLKEKTLVETFADGGVRFQGTIPLKEGGAYLDRTTLTPLENGTVRQKIEYSTDDGQTWNLAFDAVYVPQEG